MGYALGLDLGTGSLKGILINNNGDIVGIESETYPLHNPQNGYCEQNPEDWITACKSVFKKFKKNIDDFIYELEGISFSGQMHSLVLTDELGDSLRPAILWNDTRNTKQCNKIMSEYGNDILRITKNVALEGFTLPKILWVKENEPEIWENTKKIFLPKDYLRYWLTGEFQMDYSDASGTLLMDISRYEWSDEILKKYDIKKSILPTLVKSTDQTGFVKNELLKEFDFKKEVKVFSGGADNAVSSLGAGLIDKDTAISSIGTSGVFLALEESAHGRYNGKIHLFNHVLEDKYYSMGVTLAAGHSLNWFKNIFFKNTSYNDMLSNINKVPIGSGGLLFTPYILGERTPHIDSQIRGAFIGLSNEHNVNNFVRSIVEGITFSLKESKILMESLLDRSFDKIISIGGGAKSDEWLQIQADIFNAKIYKLENEEGPGLGAAMIAALGLGWYESTRDCVKKIIRYSDPISPIEDNVKRYEKVFEKYRKVYKATKTVLS